MSDRCETCRFFVKHEPQHIYGDCHRFPPQFGFYANVYEPDSYGSKRTRIDITRERGGVWPNIGQHDWCGEYQAGGGTATVTQNRPVKPLVEVARRKRTVTVMS